MRFVVSLGYRLRCNRKPYLDLPQLSAMAMAMACTTIRNTAPALYSHSVHSLPRARSHKSSVICLNSFSSSLFANREFRTALESQFRSTDQFVASSALATMASTAEKSSASEVESKPFGVLFVCLGNICRSPSAEAVFRNIVEKRGLDSQFNIDSAGTIDYHEGNPADSRMRASALKRGVKLTSISRPIRRTDFEEFDLILAMDKSNKADILLAYETWNKRAPLPANSQDKVKLMCDYCTKHNVTEVPDPYYGGPAGFEKVLDLLEDACEGLLDAIQTTQAQDELSGVKTPS